MTTPEIGNSGTASAASGSPAASGTTSSFAVQTGDSVYVFVGYATNASGGVTVGSVADTTGNVYKRAGGVLNTETSLYPAIEVWYADRVPANSSLRVTVTFLGGSTIFTISAVEITGADSGGSLDARSSGDSGSSFPTSAPSSEDPISTVTRSDLVIACVCYSVGVGTIASGGSFSASSAINLTGGGAGNVGISGFIKTSAAPASSDSKLYGTSSPYPFAILTVAVRQAVGVQEWSGTSGRPFVVVSPNGISNGLSEILNDGSDFGPDTMGTTTYGIQEALNFIAETGGLVYCRNGAYALKSPLMNTGSNQVVVFAPGCSVMFNVDTTPISADGRYFLILVGSNLGTNPTTYVNYSYNAWYGNGSVINANGVYADTSDTCNLFGIVQAGLDTTMSPPPAGSQFIIDGFFGQGLTNSIVYICVQNYQKFTSPTPYANQVRNVRISRLDAEWDGSTQNGSGLVINGSARQCLIEDCKLDCSEMEDTANGVSNLFIHSNAGDTSQVVVRRSTFLGPLAEPIEPNQTIEFQGNDTSISPGTVESNCYNLSVEDCVFDAQNEGLVAFIDDYESNSGNVGWVYNVSLERCQLLNGGINYNSRSTGILGYIRYTDGTIPPSTTADLLERSPGDGGMSIASAVTSGVPWQNMFGFDVRVNVYSSSGSISAISVNGIGTGVTSGSFVIRTGDTLTLTFSGSPTIQAQAL
jgi:hypothetical protein